MTAAACAVLLVPSAWGQVAVIAAGGLVGLLLLASDGSAELDPLPFTVSRQAGVIALALFFALLIGLPLMTAAIPGHTGQMEQTGQIGMGQIGQIGIGQTVAVVDAFYRAGALVFGGGHVVLPMLQAEVVPPGWVANDTFLAGYGAAQAVPGPLFTFAAFLGASMNTASSGWSGALICLLAIFTPSFLLVVGAAPFWEKLRGHRQARSALSGIDAAVVGVLLAALYQPVWTSAIHRPQDFAVALTALVALMSWRVPPWLVVLGCAPAAWMLGRWLN